MTKTSTKTNSIAGCRLGGTDGSTAASSPGCVWDSWPASGVGGAADVGDLYVTEEGPGNVWQFDGLSGAPQGFFNAAPMSGNLMAIHTGGTVGDVLVGSSFGGVYRLDRNTGNVVQTFNASGGWQWAGVWRPNTNTVLIGDMNTDDIREYDANTGAFTGVFATGVSNPADMIFGPDGDLYVCSFTPARASIRSTASPAPVVTQWGRAAAALAVASPTTSSSWMTAAASSPPWATTWPTSSTAVGTSSRPSPAPGGNASTASPSARTMA